MPKELKVESIAIKTFSFVHLFHFFSSSLSFKKSFNNFSTSMSSALFSSGAAAGFGASAFGPSEEAGEPLVAAQPPIPAVRRVAIEICNWLC